jgi:hypothetical protein
MSKLLEGLTGLRWKRINMELVCPGATISEYIKLIVMLPSDVWCYFYYRYIFRGRPEVIYNRIKFSSSDIKENDESPFTEKELTDYYTGITSLISKYIIVISSVHFTIIDNHLEIVMQLDLTSRGEVKYILKKLGIEEIRY